MNNIQVNELVVSRITNKQTTNKPRRHRESILKSGVVMILHDINIHGESTHCEHIAHLQTLTYN